MAAAIRDNINVDKMESKKDYEKISYFDLKALFISFYFKFFYLKLYFHKTAAIRLKLYTTDSSNLQGFD